MGTYIVMFVCDLLVPLAMVIFGAIFMKNPPEEVNDYYGYRTPRSTATPEAWDAAHRYFGRLWLIVGAILTPLSVAALVPLAGMKDELVALLGLLITIAQCVAMLVPIIPTERMLKRRFGE